VRDPERKKATDAAYYLANRERKRAMDAAWYAAHREERAAYGAAWHAANPEKAILSSARSTLKRSRIALAKLEAES